MRLQIHPNLRPWHRSWYNDGMEFEHDDRHLIEGRKRDFDDLQNEYAGRQTGRMTRFLPSDDHSPEAKRKKRSEQAAHSLLEMMLSNPIYRARYEAVSATLSDAVSATESVLVQLGQAIENAAGALDDIRARAARLPDGARVYRDAQGNIRREDGSIIDDTLAATIIWSGTEPSFEALTGSQTTLADAEAAQESVLIYQNDVLGPAQDQMADPDSPPSLEELDQILEQIETEMPAHVRAEITTSSPPEPDTAKTADIKLPKL